MRQKWLDCVFWIPIVVDGISKTLHPITCTLVYEGVSWPRSHDAASA